MLTAASRAFSQMLSPPFRSILFKSAGAALAVLIVLAILLQRLLAWAVDSGGVWLSATFPWLASSVVTTLEWALIVVAGVGLFAAAILLMPAVTALVAGFFADDIAEKVERTYYPGDPPGAPLPVAAAMTEGARAALFGILIYLCAVPFLFFAGFGAIIFFVATAFVLGREYFNLAAMRFHPPDEAKALRRRHATAVFQAGLLIAAFVSIPIVNLATPLFATALMVHIHKRLAGPPQPG